MKEGICLAGVIITGLLLSYLVWKFKIHSFAGRIGLFVVCLFWISLYYSIGSGILSDNWNAGLGLAVLIIGITNISIVLFKKENGNAPKSNKE